MLKRFKPKTLPAIITFGLFCLLVALGLWQTQRAIEKQTILQQYEQMLQSELSDLDKINDFGQLAQHQPIKLTGSFDNQHQFLLDNKIYGGRLGYEVITPVITEKAIVLVNRGWVPAGSSRASLPKLTPVQGEQQLQGLVYRPIKSQMLLSSQQENPDAWPRVIQRLNFDRMAQALGKPVANFIMRLDQNQAYSFISDWKIINMPPSKHKMYAFQWFILALVLLILFFALSLERRSDESSDTPSQ